MFLPRPDRPNGGDPDDLAEQQRLAMAYRFHPEFASGSGAAVHAVIDENNPLRAKQIHIRTVPDYEMSNVQCPMAVARTSSFLAALIISVISAMSVMTIFIKAATSS